MIPTRYPSNGSKYSIAAGYGTFARPIRQNNPSFGTRYTHTSLNASWNETALIDSELNTADVKNTAMTGSFLLPTARPRVGVLIFLLPVAFDHPILMI